MGVIPQPGILEIKLYQGGASHVEGVREVLKLSSNENPFGPPQSARDALVREAHLLHRYPPTDHAALRNAIAEVHALEADQIICGVGSDEVLTFICQAFSGVGDEVIYTEHGFSMYPLLARGAGAVPIKVKEAERVVDVDAILSAVTEKTRIVFVTNPGNPTGTMLPEGELERLADMLRDDIVLVVDGAYAEYATGYGMTFDGGAALANARPNVVMTRTFSKLYGLGGLRVGWGYAQRELIDVLNRLRGPFNLSNPALAAAEAAVRDRDFASRNVAENARMRDWLANALRDMGVEVDPSQANFILARFKDEAQASACEAALQSEGILVRKVSGYGFPEALRVTVGDESGCRRVVHAVRGFMGVE